MTRTLIRLIAPALALSPALAAAAPQESAFTYQGRLEQDGAPASGDFDFSFALFAAASGGSAIGGTLQRPGVAVEDGLFTVMLDFGSTAFDGSQRFLQVSVNATPLSPRTAIGTTPYASVALASLDAGMAQSTAWRGATNHVVAPESQVTASTPTRFSATIGADGLPIVAYYAVATLDLNVAICHDTVCSSVSSVTLDSAGDVGDFNSITLGADERPVISYYDRSNGDLKVARCNDRQCTGASTRAVDTLGDTGQFTSITTSGGAAAGLEGNKRGPLIAYYDASNRDLRYLRCQDADCDEPVGLALDTAGDVGQFASIAYDGTRVQVAYQDVGNKRLKLAVCGNSQCSSVILRTLDSQPDSGFAPSIALTPAGRALVSHTRYDGTGNEFILVRCNVTASTSTYCDAPAAIPVFTSSSDELRSTQLLMRNGIAPLIWDGQFRVAGCEDPTCTVLGGSQNASGVQTTLTASRSAAAVGADGLPLLLVQGGGIDGTPRGIKAIHCASASCRSYGRER